MRVKLFLTGLLAASTIAIASENCDSSKVNVSEAQKALSGVLGNAKVISVSNTPINGLYEIVIENMGRKIPIYADCSFKYIVNGEIIDVSKKVSLTRERFQQLQAQSALEKEAKLTKILGKNKVEALKSKGLLEAINIVDLKNLPKSNVTYGNGSFKIYVLTDPQCPFCARFHEEIKKVLAKRKDVSFEMIMYPLPFHKHASGIAQNIICQNDNTAKQKIMDNAFSYTSKNNEKALASLENHCDTGKQVIDANLKYGQTNGIDGVPTVIFPQGIAISGVLPADLLNELINILK
ncbi:MAG: DsbC family protein [Sulfurihydrogenibium sp.]|jgi:thiol:disulfide interchange protein DsbC|nr:DsbC family protein [Sulfurihydrogenibium sp.]